MKGPFLPCPETPGPESVRNNHSHGPGAFSKAIRGDREDSAPDHSTARYPDPTEATPVSWGRGFPPEADPKQPGRSPESPLQQQHPQAQPPETGVGGWGLLIIDESGPGMPRTADISLNGKKIHRCNWNMVPQIGHVWRHQQ